MEFKTFYDLNNDLISNFSSIPHDVDLIIGIPRSGLILANLIAVYLNLPLTDLNSFLEGKIYNAGGTKNKKGWVQEFSQVKKALIVEDSVCTGLSINKAKAQISKLNSKIRMVYLAAYITKDAKDKVDLYFKVVSYPRLFEWNYLHQPQILEKSCFDIDGVLCVDPTVEQNDDGSKYLDFILNAPVKFLPSHKIGWLVTSRLEKYRTPTETWLKKNNVQYGKLIMMNLPSAEERQKLKNHAVYKANIYKNIKEAQIFVESEKRQALEISSLTKKQVFCIENQKYYSESKWHKISNTFSSKIKIILRTILPNYIYCFLKRKSH